MAQDAPIDPDFRDEVTAALRAEGRPKPREADWMALALHDDAFRWAGPGDRHLAAQAADFLRSRRPPVRIGPAAEEGPPAAHLLAGRSDAASAWAHRLATELRDVVRWRHHHLDGGLLDPSAVDGWVDDALTGDGADGDEVLRWGAFDGDRWEERTVEVGSAGQLGELAAVSRMLSDRFTWSPAEATVFVLTGLDVLVFPIRAVARMGWAGSSSVAVTYTTFNRVTITVDPAVSPAELAAWWKECRRSLPGGSPRRLQVERQTTLARFMATRWATDSTWADDWRVWNRTYPDWDYSSVGGFRTEALRAMEGLGITVPKRE